MAYMPAVAPAIFLKKSLRSDMSALLMMRVSELYTRSGGDSIGFGFDIRTGAALGRQA
jgi:hypothetical protein